MLLQFSVTVVDLTGNLVPRIFYSFYNPPQTGAGYQTSVLVTFWAKCVHNIEYQKLSSRAGQYVVHLETTCQSSDISPSLIYLVVLGLSFKYC